MYNQYYLDGFFFRCGVVVWRTGLTMMGTEEGRQPRPGGRAKLLACRVSCHPATTLTQQYFLASLSPTIRGKFGID